MKINQPVQPPTNSVTPSSPGSGQTHKSNSPVSANAQLIELKQQLGDVVRAKILAVEPKGNAQVTNPEASQAEHRTGQRSQADLAGQNAKTADLYRRNLLNQEALGSGKPGTHYDKQMPNQGAQWLNSASKATPMPQLWQISLKLAGLNNVVTTEFQASQLPGHWVKGNTLTLSIDPTAGLRVLLDSSIPATQSIKPLLQSLARFLPLQSDFRSGLQTLLAGVPKELGSTVTRAAHSHNPGHRRHLEDSRQPAGTSPTTPASVSAEAIGSAKNEAVRQLLAALLSAPKTSLSTPVEAAKTTSAAGIGSPGSAAASNPNVSVAGGTINNTGGVTSQKSPTPLPPLIKDLLTVVNKTLLTPAQSQDPAQLKAGLKRSGLAMESSLLASKTHSNTKNTTSALTASASNATGNANHSSHLVTDIKAWLDTLRSTGNLSDPRTVLSSPLLKEVPADLKALLLTTLSATMSHLRQSPDSHQLPTSWESLVSWLMPRTANFHPTAHPLQFPGQIGQASRQALTTEGLDAGEILRALAQTIARIQVNQFNLLQQNASQPGDLPPNQVWFAELPILGQQLDTLQIRLEKESQHQGKAPRKHQWKLVLAFDFAALGPLQSHVIYTDGTVSATFWADRQQTLRLINEEVPKLRKGLNDWGVTVGEIKVRKGHPPSPQNPVSHQLLDERA